MASGAGRTRAWVFLAFWIVLTCFALTFPFRKTPRVLERGYDKVVHTSLFTVMSVSAQAAAPWVSLLITGPFAVGLEMIQKKIPHRTYSTVDMLANFTGIVLGIFAFELSRRLK
jgi:VanZ family protein